MKYEIVFYEDKNGVSPVFDYLRELSLKSDKNSRVNHKKILEYISVLEKYGKEAGLPYVRHLDKEIWELRPIRNRLLFASFIGNTIIILHYFIKKTQKTPKKEIEKAKKNLVDIINRREILWKNIFTLVRNGKM